MQIFKLRPLAFGCSAFLVSLALSYFLGNVFSISIIIASSLSLLLVVVLRLFKNTRHVNEWLCRILPLCLCLALCGTISLLTFSRDKETLSTLDGEEQEIQLVITDIRYSNANETVAIASTKENDLVVSLASKKDVTIKIGDTVRARVTFHALEHSPVGYSEKEYYLDKGIFLCAETEDYEILSSGKLMLKGVLVKINAYLDDILEKSLNSDTYSLVSAMLLGNKSNLDSSVRRDFSRLGISHILALSGIHISLITGLFSAFLDTIQMRRRLKCVILISMIGAFVGITGFSESAMRAGLMLILFYILSLFGGESDSVTALFLSVTIICVLDPYAIFSTSLLLSFFAMLGCFCSSYYTRGIRVLYRIRPKAVRGVVYSFISSVIVVLFTLPIISIKFAYVSIFAPFFNIIFVPLLTLLLYIAPFILLIGWIPYLSYVVTFPAQIITRVALFLVGNISKADFLSVSFTNVFQYIGVFLIVVAIILALALSKKRYRLTLAVLCVGVAVFVASSLGVGIYKSVTVSISTYDAQSSDILAIESNNEVMIVEMSKPTRSTASSSGAYASYIGYSDIDAYLLTDYGAKAVEALDYITKSTIVRSVYLPEPKTDEEIAIFNEAEALLCERKIPLSKIPEKYYFGDTCVDFAEVKLSYSTEKRCTCVRVSANGSTFTYLGASAYEHFDKAPRDFVRNADVVTLGSYGPKYRAPCSYDFSSTKYLVFHEDSREYVKSIPEEIIIKEDMHKFIFK